MFNKDICFGIKDVLIFQNLFTLQSFYDKWKTNFKIEKWVIKYKNIFLFYSYNNTVNFNTGVI